MSYIFWIKSYKMHTRIETEEEFNETMDKTPDYGIYEEDVSRMTNYSAAFLLNVNFRRRRPSMLRNTMRDHRLRKKELYIQAMAPSQQE